MLAGTMPVSIDARRYDAVLFDLDGVVTDTAAVHAKTWRALFDDVLPRRPQRTDEDHSPFTDADYRHYVDGKPRADGIRDFLAARGINLPEGRTDDDGDATVCGLATRKQRLFDEFAWPTGSTRSIRRSRWCDDSTGQVSRPPCTRRAAIAGTSCAPPESRISSPSGWTESMPALSAWRANPIPQCSWRPPTDWPWHRNVA